MSIRGLFLGCNYEGCSKVYSTKYNLRRHFETAHSGYKRFICRICGKILSSRQNLDEHSFTHSKINPFKCPEPNCRLAFRQRSQLSNHRKLHTELHNLTMQMRKFIELKVIFT